MSYARAIASTVGQGVLTGVWIAAGELPPHKRRAVRAAAAGAVAAVGLLSTTKGERSMSWVPGEGPEVVDGRLEESDDPEPMDPKRIAMVVGAGVLSVATLVGRHQLEKRWLARLERNGHAHPHRGLAIRMAAITMAAGLPGRLLSAHEKRGPRTG
jgi:hypothetical protein